MYFIHNLHSNYHWTLGGSGSQHFFDKHKMSNKKSRDFICSKDYFLSSSNLDLPMVINTHEVRLRGRSYISIVDKH